MFRLPGFFEAGELYLGGGRIRALPDGSEGGAVLDGRGAYAVPGLTDIHFHGCAGHDFSDGTAEAIRAIAGYELSRGITQICPATMTLPEETLMKISRAAAAHKNGTGARLVGINMEGPFISEKKKGAQNGRYIRRPDAALFRRLQAASGGLCRLVDIAPECEGALAFIDELKGEVKISLAHTEADYETAAEALRRGAGHITHLFNAMPPFSHRAPGVVGAAFDDPDCEVELIADGVHVAAAMVRAAFRLFGDDRVILISDSMRAAGLSDGVYTLGGQPVYVRGPRAQLADGTIAGSVTDLMGCMRTAVLEMGIPLVSAVKAAAVNPARSIGIDADYGSLEPGKAANLVLLDERLQIQDIIFDGRLLT